MRSQTTFFRISSLSAFLAVIALAVFGIGNAQASPTGQAATASAMSTMPSDSAVPPCPQNMMAATMSATMQSMSGTPDMSATMAMAPAATMSSGAATMAPTMSATMFVMQSAMMSGCKFTATLAGSNEVPKAGDPNAKGTATVLINRPAGGPGEICFVIQVSGIKLPATASHIHSGAAGVAGPVVVPFQAPDANGNASGCTENVDPNLISAILSAPANYYVNVHNSDFPGGAMRGQLVPATQ